MPPDDGGGSLEDLVELESELTSPETGVTGQYEEGTVAGATRLPAADVPDDYPVDVGTGQALRLDVEAGGETVPTYLPWPDAADGSSRLERLLQALGYDAAQFANVYGDRVALTPRDGWHVVDVEGTRRLVRRPEHDPRGSRTRAYYGVAAALGLGVLAWVLVSLSAESAASAALALFAASYLGLPAAIYRDAGAADDQGVWSPRTPVWLAGSLVPAVRTGLGLVYLLRRRSTFAAWPKPWSWPGPVAAAAGLMVLGVVGVSYLPPGVSAVLLVYVGGWAMLVGSLYYDLAYLDQLFDLGAVRLGWLGGAVVTSMFAFVLAPAYLAWRYFLTE